MKSYFNEVELEDAPRDEGVRPDLSLVFSSKPAVTKEELLAALPEQSIVNQLIYRYFNSNSPALREWFWIIYEELLNSFLLDIIHKPTFQRDVCNQGQQESFPS